MGGLGSLVCRDRDFRRSQTSYPRGGRDGGSNRYLSSRTFHVASLCPQNLPPRQDALGERPHPQFLSDDQRLILQLDGLTPIARP